MIGESMTIGFIGLGLIGGSIAKTIRRIHPDSVLYAYDTDKTGLSLAVKEGVINYALDEPDRRLSDCSILFLCAPVSVNIHYLQSLRDIISDSCLVTDGGEPSINT